MSEISIYDIVPTPKLADKLIGTSVGGVIEDVTYNFTLQELLQLFIPNLPANNLQGVLDYGNTATQDINLTGTITTSNLSVLATANILNSNLSGNTRVMAGLFDRTNASGTVGQVLRSTGTQVEWFTIPTVIPTLQQVLQSGNTSNISIVLTANITAVTATVDTVISNTSLNVNGVLRDGIAAAGASNQILSSTGSGVRWVDMPVYNVISPLLYDTPTKTFSIRVANGSQSGYLSAADWVNFDGKQGAIILTTIGTSGASTFVGNTLNIPVYTPNLSGYVPTSRTLTINGTTYDLSANRSWTLATGVGLVTATSPLFSSGGAYPDITIQKADSSLNGYLSNVDWLTFNNKQPAGNYITSLTGEATGVGPGATAITLTNASVIAKLLTGLNVIGSSISSSDSILTAFGKIQNQINGLIGGVQYQGVWNAATNTPALVSSVGTQGYYYIVSVAGNTNLNGITDWQVGDWAIFNGSTWNKVDNTDLVTSVNGQVGAVNLTTDNIPEGTTNLYYLNSRARTALSFAAGSGAYDNTTGVITIPTNNNQITNGSNYITLASLSAASPLSYNNTTGALSIQVANATQNGYLSNTDWTTFNSKQAALNGTGFVKVVGTTISYDNSTYYLASNPSAFIALTALSAGAGISYNNTTGIIASTITQYTDALARASVGLTTIGTGGASTYNSTTGVFNIPNYGTALANYLPLTGGTLTGGLFINPVNSAVIGLDAASDTFRLRSDSTQPFARQLVTTMGSGTLVKMQAAGYGATYVTDLGFYTSSNAAVNSTPNIYLTGGDNRVGINTITPAYTLDVIGTAGVSGVFTLGSTISNGTFIYTLPSATGTLALVGGSGVGTVTSVAALTLGTTGTDLSSSVANSTTTPVITLNVPTASATNRGALSSADWTTFDSKQVAGNYIVSLTGEATAVGPGAAAVTLNNASVTGKILTGVNITGGTVLATDTMLTAFGKLQNQINGLVGSTIYQGVWNASTNTPTLTSSVGTNGFYYIVNVAGSTNLNGITDWKVGDWAIFNGGVWQKVDNTDAVTSVNGFTGAVSLTTDNVAQGTTNLYFSNALARAAISLTVTGASGASTYNNTTGVLNVPTYTLSGLGGQPLATNLTSLSSLAFVSTSFVKMTAAGTFALDTSVYYLASNPSGFITSAALAAYLPLSGGTLTGALSGTSATFSGNVTSGTATNSENLFIANGITYSGLRLQRNSVNKWAIFNNNAGTDFFDIYNYATSSSALTIASTGAATFSSSVTARNFGINEASAGRGGLYPYNLVAGSGIDYSVGVYSESEIYFASGGSATKRVVITSGGNVGINTTAPLVKFSVVGVNGAESGTATPNGSISIGETGANNQLLTMGVLNGAGNHSWIQSRNSSTTSTYALALNPSGGNVLIGTTTDSGYKLDVNGTGRFQSSLLIGNFNGEALKFQSSTSTGSSYLRFYNSAGTSRGYLGLFWNGTTDYMVYDAGSLQSNFNSSNSFTFTGGGQTSFSAQVNINQDNIWVRNPTNTIYRGIVLGATVADGTEYAYIKYQPQSGQLVFFGSPSGFGGNTIFQNNATTWLTVSSSNALSFNGAATFSSSLTVGAGGLVGRLSVRGTTNDSSAFAFEAANSSGNSLLAVRNDGAATFSSSLNVGTNIECNNGYISTSAGSGTTYSSRLSTVYSYPYIYTYLDSLAGASYDGRITFRIQRNGGAVNPVMSIIENGSVGIGTTAPTDYSGYTTLHLNGKSGANGGLLRLTAFDSSSSANIYAGGSAINFNTTSAVPFIWLTQDTERMRITSGGNVLIGTTTDAGYKLNVNGNAFLGNLASGNNVSLFLATNASGGPRSITYRAATAYITIDNTSGAAVMTVDNGGAVTASSFFESSDSRLKKLIDGSPQIAGIEKLEAKLYEKNGKIEMGYFAQDAQLIMPYAVQTNDEGFLNLSYREVHTAKIYALEQEIKELKAKLN